MSARFDLVGTIWSGIDSRNQRYTFEFREDHVLHYTSPTGTWKNGRWRRDGDWIHVDMNDHYSDYRGVIARDRIYGQTWNINGLEWTWCFYLET